MRPPSPQTRIVLRALLRRPGQLVYGLEIVQATALKSGTVYPILRRLEAQGALTHTHLAPSESGGAQRRLYRIDRASPVFSVARLPVGEQPADPPGLGGLRKALIADLVSKHRDEIEQALSYATLVGEDRTEVEIRDRLELSRHALSKTKEWIREAWGESQKEL